MDNFTEQIARSAAEAVAFCESRDGFKMDYSESSLAIVEDMLAEVAAFAAEITPDQLTALTQDFGNYVLEVGRREFGGRYVWHTERDQPVLVVGEPAYRVAIMAWDKVRGRLTGEVADNIPFHYAGFAERARRASPGTDVLFV
jgi:hypothetical protein